MGIIIFDAYGCDENGDRVNIKNKKVIEKMVIAKIISYSCYLAVPSIIFISLALTAKTDGNYAVFKSRTSKIPEIRYKKYVTIFEVLRYGILHRSSAPPKNGVKGASFLHPITKNTFPSLLIIYSTLVILAILIIASGLEQFFDQGKFTKKNTSWIKTPITIFFFALLMGIGMALASLFEMEVYCLMQRTNYNYCQHINLDCTNENGFNITRSDNGITYSIDSEGKFHYRVVLPLLQLYFHWKFLKRS